MSNHFSGVFIHNFPSKVADLRVLCVQDARYLQRPFDGTPASLQNNGDVKMPGGMGEDCSGGRKETPCETMAREAVSETGVQILGADLVYAEVQRPETAWEHWRYFFLATEVSGLPPLDSLPRVAVERNARDGTEEMVYCSWVPLRIFADRLFNGQWKAFGAVLARLAQDNRDFCLEYLDLLQRFPAPEDQPGLEVHHRL